MRGSTSREGRTIQVRYARTLMVFMVLLWAGLFSGVVSSREADGGVFVEVAASTGISFSHFNGMAGSYTIAEITGQGAGLVDIDNDGDLDLYLVQGALLRSVMDDALFPWQGTSQPSDRLFRNDLVVKKNGERVLKFTDITAASGITARGYGMGVAAGDFDGDGRVDLYVTNLGANSLYRNLGDGRFEDVTAEAGVEAPRWSTGAAFLDYDRDGDLDLFVANYVTFEQTPERECFGASSARDFCGPDAYDAVPDLLFMNRGDGAFVNVTQKAGISKAFGAGFGVVTTDFNGDGWIDIYVANDGDPNQLWINNHNGSFTNNAMWAGAAVNAEGMAEASMGVDAGDFDGDGDEDLFMTHLMEETNTLFVNDGSGLFEDRTSKAGLTAVSRGRTGFGTAWIDYDNDSWLDLLIVNGAVRTLPNLARAGDPYPLGQPNYLLRNRGNGHFKTVDKPGASFRLIEVSRGAAIGDVDNDGDTDVLVSNNNGPVRLLLNQVGNLNRWIGLRLLLAEGVRDALGARVEVVLDSGASVFRQVRSDGSFCSARDSRILIGLGHQGLVKAIRVTWPDGSVEIFPSTPLETYSTLRQGTSIGDGEKDGK